MRLFGIGGVFDLSIYLSPSSLNELLDDVLPSMSAAESRIPLASIMTASSVSGDLNDTDLCRRLCFRA